MTRVDLTCVEFLGRAGMIFVAFFREDRAEGVLHQALDL